MKKAKKTIAGMESLFEIRQYDMKNSCFKLQGGRCMDLVRVICTDFQSIREVDLEYENLKMEQFYSRYPSDIKLVCVICRSAARSNWHLFLISWKTVSMSGNERH